jgi:methionyl-tRNA formyltransferase
VDWDHGAAAIYNRYRGFQPWPGAWTTFRGARLQLKELVPAPQRPANNIAAPGTLFTENKRLFVMAGDGAVLALLRVQLEGRAAVSAEAFLNGAHLQPKERLGAE